ncbi:MAG: DNA repair exonuclease [Actinobacteria bacterium]|nr:DNA repair exonuclease [Actinomycetota bacterium]
MAGLRLLHTADVHLGAAFGFLGRRGREQRDQLKATFSRVIDLAITSQVDALLVAGDLFDSAYPQPALVGEVMYQLQRLDSEGIWTLIAPGTHDRLQPGGVYESDELTKLAHVHVFRDREMTARSISGLDLDVYGMAVDREGKDVLSGFRAGDAARWRVGILHASFILPGKVERDEMLVSAESVAGSNLHYLALGHWHTQGDYSRNNTPAFYSGSPEPLDIGSGEEGRVLMVELEEGSPARVKPISVGRRRMSRLELDVSGIGGPTELYAYLRRMADRDLVLEVRLKGIWGDDWAVCDWDRLEDELAPLFFQLHLVISPAGITAQDVDTYPERTVMGRFVRIAREEMEGKEGEELLVAEEAFRLGLTHLAGRP